MPKFMENLYEVQIMKAVVIENFGGAETLKLKEVPEPIPQENEVLIRVEYTAVNPVDWKIREGLLKSRLPHEFPLIPGWDAAGVIAEVGSNVRQFKIGDEVYAYCRKPIVKEGTYAEFVTFDAAQVALKPKNISFAEAAAIPLASLTAWQGLFDFANLKENQSVLIHAGSGGVGSFAIQFARHAQAEVWTTCSLPNHSYVKQLGAREAIDYTKENFVTAIKKKKNDGFDVIFDGVGGKTLQDSYSLLKPGGVLVSIVEKPSQQMSTDSKTKMGFIFVRPDGEQLGQIGKLIEEGKVKIPHIVEMNLQEAAYAQEESKKGHTQGKIVLKVRGPL